MMTQKELIKGLQDLRNIQPDRDWVFSTKNQILGVKESKISQVLSVFKTLYSKPAFATLTAFAFMAIITGGFFMTKNSLPGDPLYIVKRAVRAAERTAAAFLSNSELAQVQLKIANKRLEELVKIAQTNQVDKLAPAVEEYQAGIAEAARNIAKIAATTSDPAVIKKFAGEIQKLQEGKQKLKQIYGISGLDAKEEFDPAKVIAGWLINDLEKRTLTEEQNALFGKAKLDFEAGLFNSALEKILSLNQL